MKLTPKQYIILSLIAQHPMHGYDIEQHLKRSALRDWIHLAFSSIYYLLRKLEDANLLRTKTPSSPDNRTKALYHLTPEGQQALETCLHDMLVTYESKKETIDIALLQNSTTDPQHLQTLLNERLFELNRVRNYLQVKFQQLQSSSEAPPYQISSSIPTPPSQPQTSTPSPNISSLTKRLMYERKLHLITTEQTWIEQAINELKKLG